MPFHVAIETFPFKGSFCVGYVGSSRRVITVVPLSIDSGAGCHIHWNRRVIEVLRGVRRIVLLGIQASLDKSLAVPWTVLISSDPIVILLSLVGTPVLFLSSHSPLSIQLIYVGIESYGFLGSLY